MLIDRNTQLLTISCDLGARKKNHMRVSVQLYYRFNQANYRLFLMNVDVDFCEFMSSKKGSISNVFLASVMKEVSTYSNLNHPCPYTGWTAATNLTFSLEMFAGVIIPSGQYRIDVNIYDSQLNSTIIYPKIYFTIPNSNDARLDLTFG